MKLWLCVQFWMGVHSDWKEQKIEVYGAKNWADSLEVFSNGTAQILCLTLAFWKQGFKFRIMAL